MSAIDRGVLAQSVDKQIVMLSEEMRGASCSREHAQQIDELVDTLASCKKLLLMVRESAKRLSRYRIDFFRQARSLDEVGNDYTTQEFFDQVFHGRAKKAMESLHDKINENGGYLDHVVVIDKSGMSSKDLFEKHVKAFMPEARLSSWDERLLWDESTVTDPSASKE